jgi:uncharacterized damage-inducible protein DinB
MSATSSFAWVLIHQFQQQARLWRAGVRDVPAELWQRPPASDLNPLAFLATHILESRYYVCGFLGHKLANPLSEAVQKAKSTAEIENYPTPEQLLNAWQAVETELPRALAEASDAWLLEPMTSRIPMQIERRLDMLGFFAHHEAYHLGQLGSARKALGLPVLLDALRAADPS